MFNNFWRKLISNFSYFFLFAGIAYFILPYFGYQVNFLMILEQHYTWVTTVAIALIIIGAIGVGYIYKTDNSQDD